MRAILVFGVFLSGCAVTVHPPAAGSIHSGSPEHVVQAQLEAYNRRDVDAFVATYADDVRIWNHPDELQLSGSGALRKSYGEFFAGAPNLRATVTRRIVQGDYVIDHEHVTGLPDGGEVRAVAIYEVRDGKIQGVWFIQ